MSTELKIPAVGESITEVDIGEWRKREGDPVQKDEPIALIESEKANVELPAPVSGVLVKILKQKGETAAVGSVIAYIDEAATPAPSSGGNESPREAAVPSSGARVMPAAQRLMDEKGLRAEEVPASGPGGRLLKQDVVDHLEKKRAPSEPAKAPESKPPAPPTQRVGAREEDVVPMTRLRRTVGERLVKAQHAAALLTTFNEVDMSAVIQLRKEYGEAFLKKYGAKLGFMSFFVKAAVDALRSIPEVNAEVRDQSIVYHNYCDIGVAIGGGKGLVVPVLRNVERLSFAEIEVAIADFAKRAKDSQLKIEELQGGTFTISNGGVYGSLLSTPIVNPPQSGILGLHAIQERPVAREGAVVIRPMMYVALTYDHRIVDGREAVTFLKRIKEVIESPARLLMEV